MVGRTHTLLKKKTSTITIEPQHANIIVEQTHVAIK